jgi:hypothetical protein
MSGAILADACRKSQGKSARRLFGFRLRLGLEYLTERILEAFSIGLAGNNRGWQWIHCGHSITPLR